MSGINGKNGRFLKKLDVAESRVPALGFVKIRFKHITSLGDKSISLGSLTVPTEATANGFVQPSTSILSGLNLKQFRDNFTLQSSLRGMMDDYTDYVVTSNSEIRLLVEAEEGEIFTGTLDYNARTGVSMVDAQPLVATGILAAAETDFSVGPYEVGKNPDSQVGAVMVLVDGIMQARNSGNSSTVLDGNYCEVHAGGGLGTIIRFNNADPINDRNVIVLSVGALAERPSDSQQALIEALQGQLDAVIPTLAALAGVPETDFQATPSNVDLKAFGDRVLTMEGDLGTKQVRVKNAYIKDVKASGIAGGTNTTGIWEQRVLNTLEGDTDFIVLGTNEFTLQPGTYDIEISVPGNKVSRHQSRLYNITDSSTAILGTSAFSAIAGSTAGWESTTYSKIVGRLIVTEPKVFKIEHRTSAVYASYGFGVECGFGVDNIYTHGRITKLE